MVNSSPPGGQDPVYYENGQYWIDDTACPGGGEPCRHGPYDYPSGPEAPHEWAYSNYHVAGENCGNCHNVTHPVKTLIQNGVDTGIPMPIERRPTEACRPCPRPSPGVGPRGSSR